MKVTTDACLFGAWVARQAASSGRQLKKALDIGAGTGLLALMLAQKNATVHIDAAEVEKEAALQGKENFEASPWKNRATLLYTNIKSLAPFYKYDIILSNPPFYEKELQSPDPQKNIAHHSGELSLNELLKAVAIHLEPGGIFFLLLPCKRQNEIAPLLQKHSLHIHERIWVSQSTKHDYFRIMIMGGNQPAGEIKSGELAIWDDQQQYTPAFTELLKDYYLKL